MVKFLIAICAIGFSFYQKNPVDFQWFVGLAVVALALPCTSARQKWPYIPLLACSIVILGALNVFSNKWGMYGDLVNLSRVFFAENAANSLSAFLILCFFFSQLFMDELKKLGEALGLACIINSIFVLIRVALYGIHSPDFIFQRGFLDVAGMNACLIACTMPFIYAPLQRVVSYIGETLGEDDLANVAIALAYGLPLFAIYSSQSANPIVILSAMLLAIGYITGSSFSTHKWMRYALPILITLVFVTVSYFLTDSLFDSSGRFAAYPKFLAPVMEKNLWLYGFGLGSFKNLAVELQATRHIIPNPDTFWLWLHSDWLQTFFELGAVGLTTFIALFVWCVYQARNNSSLLLSTIGYGAWAMFNYPIHNFLSAALGVYLVFYAIAEWRRGEIWYSAETVIAEWTPSPYKNEAR